MKLAPTCRFQRPDGSFCMSPALRGQIYCFYHQRDVILNRKKLQQDANRRERHKRKSVVEIPPITDSTSVQNALNNILQALAKDHITPRKAGKLLHAVQLASKEILHPR